MKNKLTIALLAAAILVPATMQAQAVDTNKPNIAGRPAPSPVMKEMTDIIQSVAAKIKEKGADKLTAADLADDIKSFDALLAKHAGEKTDEIARVAIMRAKLYSDVLKDKATGDKLMKAVKEEYKDTSTVSNLIKQEAAAATSEKAQAALADGLVFPDFDVKSLDGKPLSVANYKGKVVLIDFWATWCGPCVAELPNVTKTYKEYNSKGFEVIAISLDRDRAKLDAFLKKNPDMTWAQHHDEKGVLATKYGVQFIPFTVLVGPDGKIIGKGLRGEALGEAVAKALKK